MKMTWYNNLLSKLQISGNGLVSNFLTETVMNGLIKGKVQGNSLDSAVSDDVSLWFTEKFNPWFAELSTPLGSATDKSELVSVEYYQGINDVVSALNVCRSYYDVQGDQEIITSLVTVAYLQALICEEISKEIITAYERSIGVTNDFSGKVDTYTNASDYLGTTPEVFVWPENTVISYHQKFQNMKDNEVVLNQEKTQGTRQYLPWVFTAAFGLIAWSAAAAKKS